VTSWGKGHPPKGGPPKEVTSGAAERIFFSRRDAGGGPHRVRVQARIPARISTKVGARGRIDEFIRGFAGPFEEFRGDSNREAVGWRDERCPRVDRVGAKLSSRAIEARGSRSGSRESEPTRYKRPLTRESSALARWNGTVCAVSHPRAGPALEIGSSAKAERPDSGAGFRRSDGRACGSVRLQKSTSGAWPSAPGRDERPEAAWSSPSSSGSGGRRSAGSRTGAAKSRDRWRVSRPRPPRASGVGRAGHSSMEGVLGRSSRGF
jgi:hypothetical protein